MTTLTSARPTRERDHSTAPARYVDRREHDERTNALLRAAARATAGERRRLIHEAVTANLGIADAIARRYQGRGVDADELRQVAYLGLVAAAQRFDAERGHDFVSFAVPTILGEVKRYFRDHVWTVRPPRRVQELRSAMTAASDRLCQELGSVPSADDLADHLGADPVEIREAERSADYYTAMSLDQPTAAAHGEGLTITDTLGTSEPGFDHAEALVVLRSACRALPRRDAHIVYRRFFCGWTQQEIGAELGITQMQISRLLTRILRDLRQAIGEPTPTDACRPSARSSPVVAGTSST
ncbi:sigma-70 family RNA polymerase sigma factor [Jiangella ureilytica]|uniref:Sigma-70 family RNA polymerase sigma factor n=1 Tax=Jiangella ureilytica TaxID=2530374 RepID=A0A4R4RRG7_9ACTN|nr:sigma-70 family RNA polymerase sigma factor [Jiangella ureilytica]TDC51053.1 sigma-70 family RNA polymerase sigma factor [Jiangella ureilytica]